ncbi:antitoxin MazE family protein [Geomonas oryzisoli]|uniref:Antitoxin MazE family protein n=1 Tax=Geomonas oryzisoli TaxID=2847992 RepID=A0ABX8J4G9_9BACT|nr:antitoxin MazE family protein [Geomonas oryzisoli]QWV93200.1 antitoxin MazE family protein [Geomonas oryzisoli]
MQPTRDRVQNYRAKLREAGLKPVQIWVPDPATPGFEAECLRQSRLALQDPQNLQDLEDMAEVADWGEE